MSHNIFAQTILVIILLALIPTTITTVQASQTGYNEYLGENYYYHYSFDEDSDPRGKYLGGFAFQYKTGDTEYNGPTRNNGFLEFWCKGELASFRSDGFKMTADELKTFRIVTFMLKTDLPQGGWIDVVIWIRGKSAAEANIPFHIGGTSRKLLIISKSMDWHYFQLDIWSAVKDWIQYHQDSWYEWYIEWYIHPAGQEARVALDDFTIKTLHHRYFGGKYYYYGFGKDTDQRGKPLGGFTFQYKTGNTEYDGPKRSGELAHSPTVLVFTCKGELASFRSDVFKMTINELKIFRIVSFLLKAELPQNGWIDVVMWIRPKTAVEADQPFHIGGTSRKLITIKGPTDWRYYQADIWSAIKDWVYSHPDEWYEWYIEWYVNPVGQEAKIGIDDFAVKPVFKLPERNSAYAVVIDIETDSDWTTINFDGGSLIYWVYEFQEIPGEAYTHELHVYVSPTSIHISKRQFDQTPVRLKIIGYMDLSSDPLRISIEKGDLGKTTVRIYKVWGYTEELELHTANDLNIADNPVNLMTVYWYWSWSFIQYIVFHNPFKAHISATIYYEDCSPKPVDLDPSVDPETYMIEARKPVVMIDFNYSYPNDFRTGYRVIVMHSATIYLQSFPEEWGKIYAEDGSKGFAVVKAYSWENYDIENLPGSVWFEAPKYLEFMVGSEMAYVEEDLAGRVFVLFWSKPASIERIRNILDELGITNERDRKEIAATALWAVFLAYEAKNSIPDPYLCEKVSKAILKRYYKDFASLGMDGIDQILLSILEKIVNNDDLLNTLINFLHSTWYETTEVSSKDDLYTSILLAVWSQGEYTSGFKGWYKVSPEKWVKMCRILEDEYQVETVYKANLYYDGFGEVIPTYAHALVGPWYKIYSTGKSMHVDIADLIFIILNSLYS